MKLGAYVLAADPTWIATSVSAYYDVIDRLLVSYDLSGVGWTGRPIASQECLDRIRSLDQDKKVVFAGGNFHRADLQPLEAETEQRRQALVAFGPEFDWVLQLDTDEVVPNIPILLSALEEADRRGAVAVEWPMQVLYRKLSGGRYLVVSGNGGVLHTEYPGAIAVKPSAQLLHARSAAGPILRYCVTGDSSLQVSRPPATSETRLFTISADDVIWHNSWARSPKDVWGKVRSWGHADGLRTIVYFLATWWPASKRWRSMRNFHPFADGLWRELRSVDHLPFNIASEDKP